MKCVQVQLKAGAQVSKVGHWKTITGSKSKAEKVFIAVSINPFLTECGLYNQAGKGCILWYQGEKKNLIT